MKATIESTEKLIDLILHGVPVQVRVWEGVTDGGVPFHAYIMRVAVQEGRPAADYVQFEKELKEQKKPTAEVAAIPARLIL